MNLIVPKPVTNLMTHILLLVVYSVHLKRRIQVWTFSNVSTFDNYEENPHYEESNQALHCHDQLKKEIEEKKNLEEEVMVMLLNIVKETASRKVVAIVEGNTSKYWW